MKVDMDDATAKLLTALQARAEERRERFEVLDPDLTVSDKQSRPLTNNRMLQSSDVTVTFPRLNEAEDLFALIQAYQSDLALRDGFVRELRVGTRGRPWSGLLTFRMYEIAR